MKKKLFNFFIIVFCFFILGFILLNKDIINSSFKVSLSLWVNTIVPSLFPFYIISDILINYNFINYIPRFIKGFLKKIFFINDNMLSIFLISLFSGFPIYAKNTVNLYNNKLISLDEANHILIFTHFANPVFIILVIGKTFFNSYKLGFIILFIHYCSNFILGFIVRKKCFYDNNNSIVDNTIRSFSIIFINAIRKAVDNILVICGIITTFMLLSTILSISLDLNDYASIFFNGIFEITNGIKKLSLVNLSDFYKIIISACFLSFGGLSVHFQVLEQLIDSKIDYHYFFIGRIWQTIISFFFGLLVCYLNLSITS